MYMVGAWLRMLIPALIFRSKDSAMSYEYRQFYIDGRWTDPAEPRDFIVINPATEEPGGVISMGSSRDADKAVEAARRAFDGFAQTSREERRALLEKILTVYRKRYADI